MAGIQPVITKKAKERNKIMKKILILAAVAGVLTAMTGCGSLRTPCQRRKQ